MPFFGNTYTLRRYGKDQIIDGYPTAGYEDIQVVLDVQTMSDDEVIEAGGSRDEQMLKTFGNFSIRTSKQEECVRVHVLSIEPEHNFEALDIDIQADTCQREQRAKQF